MEIPKAYEPQSVEDRWYAFWQQHGCFTADPARVSDKRPAYSIVIPPPNVTGMLHMGHVLNNTIQDILSRKARMDGREVLWLPGTDHAGIATQVQVERALKKEEKKTRHDLGREEFLKRVWAWKEKHGGIIIQQLKKLGCSCDWTRERFTMDPEYSRCVQKVFVELYKKGLIYRGKRMVNWCPATQTALSDEEVEMKPQKGFMYHFKVQVAECPLTRPAGTLSPSEGEGKNIAARLTAEAPSHVGEKSEGQTGHAASSSLYPGGGEGQGEGAKPTYGPVTDSEGRTWLTIATTRPETIPGDTSVAVNPKDPRYSHLIGKHIVRPLPPELPREKKLIPIIGDEQVDFEFGTGVLKVTPAHDQADFEIGERHKLSVVDIMNPDGSMNELAGVDLKGLDRFKARKVAVEKLKEIGAFVDEKPYENNVGFSQRADVPIEPRLSEQWFLKYPAVEQAKACVEQPEGKQPEEMGSAPAPGVAARALAGSTERMTDPGGLEKFTLPSAADEASAAAPGAGALPQMHFHPQRWAKVYDHWLSNIQDWCISRQLWWGHRIPVWTKREAIGLRDLVKKLTSLVQNADLSQSEVREVAMRVEGRPTPFEANALQELLRHPKSEEQLLDMAREWTVVICGPIEKLSSTLEKAGFTQDPDVLDTWFSSWLWPFATMGWTDDKTQDSQNPTLQAFYPTTDLVTGPDIIFFWVARMIMAGYEFMGEMPFRNVYFTGIIRDKQGRKMSKSLGNSPDPLELISKYGADALRFGTMRSAPLGQDVLFDEKDVELGRNFCNKLWNACRFRQMQGSAPASGASAGAPPAEIQGEIQRTLLTPDDKWILLKLDLAIREITAALEEYKFSEATAALYRFFWSEYCDWYVEASKAVLNRASSEATPSPLGGERAGVRGSDNSSSETKTPPHPNPLPPAARGGEGEARRANTLAVIDFVLSHTLRLFHPFLPFITEELWHGMGYAEDMPENQGGRTIMNAPWPKPLDMDFKGNYGLDDCYLEMVDAKYDLVTKGRDLRRTANIPAGKKVKYFFKPVQHLAPHDAEVLKLLLNAETFEIKADYEAPKGTPSVTTSLGELFLPLEGLVDVAAEKARLTKELEKIEAEIAKTEQKLANPSFTQKAPPPVLQEHQKRLAEWLVKREHTRKLLESLGD